MNKQRETFALTKFYIFLSNLFDNLYSLKSKYFLNLEINIQTSIINKAKQGDSNALEWLYNNYCKAMFSICVKMIGKKEDAEDVLHDVFVIAFKNLHQLKNEIQFGGWLKRITINECLKHCKKQFNYNSWNDDFENIKEEKIEESWWQNISIKNLGNAIKNLPDGCRQIFYLYAVENFGHKEIANNLNISEGTSKSQYHRAKKLLREQLKNSA